MFCTAYLISVIIFGTCFDTLTPLEIGIVKNSITKSLDADHVYTAGRYLLGVGDGFAVTFPATYRHIEFSRRSDASADTIMGQTNGDGGTVRMECSFQYKIRPEKVNGKNPPGLYQYYGELNYHQKITNLAKSSLVNSIKSVKMTDFFSARQNVKKVMFDNLVKVFENDGGYIDLIGPQNFQLGYTVFPSTTEAKIIESAKENQKKEMFYNIEKAKLVQAVSFNIAGNASAQIVEMTSKVDSAARYRRNVATASAKQIQLLAEQKVNSELRAQLQFDNAQLMRYLWLKALNSTGSDTSILWGLSKVGLTEPLNNFG
jgi:hypothetical protein